MNQRSRVKLQHQKTMQMNGSTSRGLPPKSASADCYCSAHSSCIAEIELPPTTGSIRTYASADISVEEPSRRFSSKCPECPQSKTVKSTRQLGGRALLRRFSNSFDLIIDGFNNRMRSRSTGRRHSKQEELQGILDDQTFDGVFSKEDLKKWYAKFNKDNPSGVIGINEIKKLFQERFKEGDPEEVAKEILRIFDTDNSGTLEFKELLCALSITSRGSQEDKLRLAFNLVDRDGSGSIDRKEMLQLITTLHKLVGITVTRMGANDDTPETHTDHIMKVFDLDNDELISFDEFVQGVKKDPGLAHLLTAPVNPDILCRNFINAE